MPLRDRHGIFPPGGFVFLQAETGWSAPQGLRFNECVEAIIKHRLANPRFELPTDYKTVADTLDLYTCHRINFEPHYCFRETEAQKKTSAVSSESARPSLPARQVPSSAQPLAVAKPVGVVSASIAGAQILTEWLGQGGKPVAPELAEARAKTCIACPFNVPGNWKTKVGKKIAVAITEHLRVKNQLELTVPSEEKLGTCNACLCHLPLKVHVPLKHIIDHTSAETMAGFHPDCWILNESKKKILCVLPFHRGDVKLAEKLLEWIEDLGGCPKHSLLLLADAKVTDIWTQRLQAIGKASFQSVELLRANIEFEGWPIGANLMHKTARAHIASNGQNPWLWLEPDCTPLTPGWLNSIQAEYDTCKKPVMGAMMEKDGRHYVAGVAVYPSDTRHLFKNDDHQPFDTAAPELILPQTHISPLIQHRWGKQNLAPVFKEHVSREDQPNTLTLEAVSKKAVLFHRCKDGSLIDLLRNTKSTKAKPRAKIIPMIAHLDQSSGYGTLSIQMATALMKLGYQVEIYPPSWNDIHGIIPPNIRAVMKTGENPHPWNFVLFPVVFQPGNLQMNDRETIYLSMWESTRLTSPVVTDKDFTKGLALLNRCKVAVVPCAWNASCYSSCGVDVPIRICPLGVDTEVFKPAKLPNSTGRPLTFGTAGKTAYGGIRKGFGVVVEAFQTAFKTEKDVRLRVKSFAEDPPIETGKDPRIEVLQLYLDQSDLVEWYRTLDVFVSGSASEGWGRHQHEAMSIGRPVVGIDFGGVAEFFNEENGYAVQFQLAPAEGIYEGMGHYAKLSVQSMAEQMRRAYNDRNELDHKSQLAAASAKRFTVDHSARTLVSIMKEFGFL